jgi:type I restriction enzyme, S subunit
MSDWRQLVLDDLIKLQRGYDLATPKRNPGKIPVIGSAGISGWHDTAMTKGPGVVVGRAGASMGRAIYSAGDFWPLNTSLFVTDFCGNDPRFIYYLLTQIDFSGFNSGAAQPMLNRNYIKRIPLNAPPLPEQRAIATTLGALDDKIAVNDRIARAADSIAFALYKKFLFKITSKAERLCNLAKVTLGGTPDRKKIEFWTSGTVGWVNSGKANEFRVLQPSEMITKEALERSAAKLMTSGTTIIAITGATMGKISRLEIDTSGNQSLVGVRANREDLNNWIFFWLRDHQNDLIKHGTGGAQQHINKAVVADHAIRLPDRETLRGWNAQVAPLLVTTAEALRENLTLSSFRDTLLPKLVSGEIRVRDAEKLVEDAA